jgi:predicted lipoprotein with Yx(FWY)xxD motif
MKRLLIPITGVAAVAAVVALIVAIASGSSSHSTGRAAAKPTGSSIKLRSARLGRFLTDAGGRTLYLFEADKPNKSNCTSACLSLWPAYTATTTPTAGPGVTAAKIGTIRAAGGKRQVTYAGHPLYYYAPDRKPGDTTGQGLDQFGAEWYVLSAGGGKIDNG